VASGGFFASQGVRKSGFFWLRTSFFPTFGCSPECRNIMPKRKAAHVKRHCENDVVNAAVGFYERNGKPRCEDISLALSRALLMINKMGHSESILRSVVLIY